MNARHTILPLMAALAMSAILFRAARADTEEPPPDPAWILQFGALGSDYASSGVVHGSYIYVCGATSSALPAQTHAGGRDAYIRKYDMSGNEIWSRQFGSPADDSGNDLAGDASGLYLVGWTYGTLPGEADPFPGMPKLYLRKYDYDGNELWTRQYGPAFGHHVVAHPTGIYVGGLGTLDGTTQDGLVAKYDADGTEIWTTVFGSPGTDFGGALTVDDSGVYWFGETRSGFPEYGYAGGFTDDWIMKLDFAGELQWMDQYGTPVWIDRASGIASDPSGVYVIGFTYGTLPDQESIGSCDVYIRKYDRDGQRLWTRQYGTPVSDMGASIAVGASGVYVAGHTEGTMGGTTSAGSYDVFLQKLDGDGNEVWTQQFGTAGNDVWPDITVGPDDAVLLVTGYTDGSFPGYAFGGYYDAYVAMFGGQNAPPTVVSGGPYAVNEGGTVEVSASGSDPEGGDVTYAWDLDSDGTFETPGETVTFSAADLDGPSNYAIAVQVTDPGGLTSTDQATVEVANVAPTTGSIAAPLQPVPVGATVDASAPFADPGTLDAHTAVWDWGDGAITDGTVEESAGCGTASGAHIYAAPGVYTVGVTVADDDGATAESVYQFVVVFDPEGGFVTAGGWIDSPAGAYAADPTLTGKATFGFVARYQKGASVPTGNTEFQFKAGGLHFRSTSYDWLVVAGANAKFKGVGTINGGGSYQFILTATDGDLLGGGGADGFRIKITGDGGVVYDNKTGAADDSTDTTDLGGGAIVIHKQ